MKNVKGVTAVEYALVAGVITLGIIVAFEDFRLVMTQTGLEANATDINGDGNVDAQDLGVIPALTEKVKAVLAGFATPA